MEVEARRGSWSRNGDKGLPASLKEVGRCSLLPERGFPLWPIPTSPETLQSRNQHPLPPQSQPGWSEDREAGWAPQSLWEVPRGSSVMGGMNC